MSGEFFDLAPGKNTATVASGTVSNLIGRESSPDLSYS